tara:strand:- start:9383 stop:9550 length:168 start_codon:yes stop_codon:yes gene_type:complete
MGMAAFRRMRERNEAAAKAAASVPPSKPKKKRKPKAKALTNGDHDSRDGGVSDGE